MFTHCVIRRNYSQFGDTCFAAAWGPKLLNILPGFQFNWDKLTLVTNSLSGWLRPFCSGARPRRITNNFNCVFWNDLTYKFIYLLTWRLIIYSCTVWGERYRPSPWTGVYSNIRFSQKFSRGSRRGTRNYASGIVEVTVYSYEVPLLFLLVHLRHQRYILRFMLSTYEHRVGRYLRQRVPVCSVFRQK